MGPPENPTAHPENQEGRRRRLPRRSRARLCLLKGCAKRFHPRQTRQRYCGEECRHAARKWDRWKAQQRYRETAAGKQKRNGQSRRYRERVKSRKAPEPEEVDEAARVITTEHFFRPFLRSTRLLRGIRAPTAKSLAALLLARLPAPWSASENGSGAGNRRGFNPDILIGPGVPLYIQPVDATGVSPARAAMGAPASAPCGAAAATAGVARGSGPANAHRGGGGRRPGRSLRGHRRLQADRGAGAVGPGHGGSGDMADERGSGGTAGPLDALMRTRDRHWRWDGCCRSWSSVSATGWRSWRAGSIAV
jgi:hypothetical protein